MKTLNHFPVLNREGTLPADGWYHVVPIGEFYVKLDDGRKVLQVIDQKAIKAMLDRKLLEDDLLVDYEHFSYDADKTSEAAGWLKELEVRVDGLWARIEWTDAGEPAVKNKRYRFVSPVWYPEDCEPVENKANALRPLRLDTIALTNAPNLKGMRPLSNRGAGNDPLVNSHTATKGKQMKQVCALLGLSTDASEESVVEKVTALQNRAADADALKNRAETAEGKLKAAETKQLETDADAFCDEHAEHIGNRETIRAQFIANREGTEAMFAAMKTAAAKPTGTAPIHNRQQPAGKEPGKDTGDKKTATAIRNRAHALQKEDSRLGWNDAWARASAELA